jgi:hypothetical protein
MKIRVQANPAAWANQPQVKDSTRPGYTSNKFVSIQVLGQNMGFGHKVNFVGDKMKSVAHNLPGTARESIRLSDFSFAGASFRQCSVFQSEKVI